MSTVEPTGQNLDDLFGPDGIDKILNKEGTVDPFTPNIPTTTTAAPGLGAPVGVEAQIQERYDQIMGASLTTEQQEALFVGLASQQAERGAMRDLPAWAKGLQALTPVIEVLDIGRAVVTSTFKEYGDLMAFNKIGGGEDQQASFSEWWQQIEDNIGGGELNQAWFPGLGEVEILGMKPLDNILGFTFEVALDPLTYLTLGTVSGGRLGLTGAVKLAMQTGDVGLARQVYTKGLKSLSPEQLATLNRNGIAQGFIQQGNEINTGLQMIVPFTGSVAQKLTRGRIRQRTITLASRENIFRKAIPSVRPITMRLGKLGALSPLRGGDRRIIRRLLRDDEFLEKQASSMISGDSLFKKLDPDSGKFVMMTADELWAAAWTSLNGSNLSRGVETAVENSLLKSWDELRKKLIKAGITGKQAYDALGRSQPVDGMDQQLFDELKQFADFVADTANESAGIEYILKRADWQPAVVSPEYAEYLTYSRTSGVKFDKASFERKANIVAGENFMGERIVTAEEDAVLRGVQNGRTPRQQAADILVAHQKQYGGREVINWFNEDLFEAMPTHLRRVARRTGNVWLEQYLIRNGIAIDRTVDVIDEVGEAAYLAAQRELHEMDELVANQAAKNAKAQQLAADATEEQKRTAAEFEQSQRDLTNAVGLDPVDIPQVSILFQIGEELDELADEAAAALARYLDSSSDVNRLKALDEALEAALAREKTLGLEVRQVEEASRAVKQKIADLYERGSLKAEEFDKSVGDTVETLEEIRRIEQDLTDLHVIKGQLDADILARAGDQRDLRLALARSNAFIDETEKRVRVFEYILEQITYRDSHFKHLSGQSNFIPRLRLQGPGAYQTPGKRASIADAYANKGLISPTTGNVETTLDDLKSPYYAGLTDDAPQYNLSLDWNTYNEDIEPFLRAMGFDVDAADPKIFHPDGVSIKYEVVKAESDKLKGMLAAELRTKRSYVQLIDAGNPDVEEGVQWLRTQAQLSRRLDNLVQGLGADVIADEAAAVRAAIEGLIATKNGYLAVAGQNVFYHGVNAVNPRLDLTKTFIDPSLRSTAELDTFAGVHLATNRSLAERFGRMLDGENPLVVQAMADYTNRRVKSGWQVQDFESLRYDDEFIRFLLNRVPRGADIWDLSYPDAGKLAAVKVRANNPKVYGASLDNFVNGELRRDILGSVDEVGPGGRARGLGLAEMQTDMVDAGFQQDVFTLEYMQRAGVPHAEQIDMLVRGVTNTGGVVAPEMTFSDAVLQIVLREADGDHWDSFMEALAGVPDLARTSDNWDLESPEGIAEMLSYARALDVELEGQVWDALMAMQPERGQRTLLSVAQQRLDLLDDAATRALDDGLDPLSRGAMTKEQALAGNVGGFFDDYVYRLSSNHLYQGGKISSDEASRVMELVQQAYIRQLRREGYDSVAYGMREEVGNWAVSPLHPAQIEPVTMADSFGASGMSESEMAWRMWDESQQAQSEKLFDGQRQLEDLSTEELADMGLVDHLPDGGVTFNGPKTDFQEGWVSSLVEAADAANGIVLRQNYEQRLSESINRAFGGTDRAEDLAKQDGGAPLSFGARGESQFAWNGILDELAPVLRETLETADNTAREAFDLAGEARSDLLSRPVGDQTLGQAAQQPENLLNPKVYRAQDTPALRSGIWFREHVDKVRQTIERMEEALDQFRLARGGLAVSGTDEAGRLAAGLDEVEQYLLQQLDELSGYGLQIDRLARTMEASSITSMYARSSGEDLIAWTDTLVRGIRDRKVRAAWKMYDEAAELSDTLPHMDASVESASRNAAANRTKIRALRGEMRDMQGRIDWRTEQAQMEEMGFRQQAENIRNAAAELIVRNIDKNREDIPRLGAAAVEANNARNNSVVESLRLQADAKQAEADLVAAKVDRDAAAAKFFAMSPPERTTALLEVMSHGWVPYGNHSALPKDIADGLMQVNEILGRKGDNVLIDALDYVTELMKAWGIATTGFVMRNGLGGTFNNALAGVDVKSYGRFAALYAPVWNLPIPGRKSKGAIRQALDGTMMSPGQQADAFRNSPQAKRVIAKQGDEGQRIVDALAEMIRMGVLNGGTVQELGTYRIRDQALRHLVNPLSRKNAAVLTVRNLNAHMENLLRGSLALDVLSKGGSMEEAVEAVFKYHFDYDDLSGFEKGVIRRAIPFYTWSRKNLPLQLESLMTKPRVYNRMFRFKAEMEREQETEIALPKWMDDRFNIRMPFSWGGNPVVWSPDLPFAEINRVTFLVDAVANRDLKALQDHPNSPMVQFLEMSNPLIKTTTESAFGQSVFFGSSYDRTLEPLPEAWSETIGQVPFVLPAMHAAGIIERGQSGTYYSSQGTNARIESFLPVLGNLRRLYPFDDNDEKTNQRYVQNWVNWTFGVGFRTITPEQQYYSMQERYLEERERLRERRFVE